MADKQKFEDLLRMNVQYLSVILLCLMPLLSCTTQSGQGAYDNVPEIQEIPDSSSIKKPAPVSIEDLESSRNRTLSDIELVWAIPEEPVEGYIVTYGFSPEQMDKVIKLKTANLEKFEDKNYGFVFRYVLSGVPIAKTVYVAISAYNGTLVSVPSKVFKVNAA